jgi:uncharacterized protein with HEPN domain
MPSENSQPALLDIRDHILFIRGYVRDMSYEMFLGDTRTFHAVTRCLEIISEATRHLPESLKTQYPDLPWKKIAGAGNVYRHNYEDVNEKIIWDTVQHWLDELWSMVESSLKDV